MHLAVPRVTYKLVGMVNNRSSMMNNSKHVCGVRHVPVRNCWVTLVTGEYFLYQSLVPSSQTSLHVQEREDARVLGPSLYNHYSDQTPHT